MIRLVAIFIIFSAIGCSNTPERPEPTPLARIIPSLIVDNAESVRLGGNDQTGLTPAVDGQDIFAASQSGSVYRFDLDLNELWEIDLDVEIVGGIGVAKSAVYVITASARFMALNRSNGQLIFDVPLPSVATTSPVVWDDLVFIKTQIGRLISLNGQTGEIQWVEESKETKIGIRGSAPMSVHEGVLYVLWEAGRLVAYQAETGRILWERQVAVSRGRSPLERIVDSKGAPSVRNGLVAIGTRNGQVSVVDVSNGQIRWSVDSDTYPGVLVGFNAVTAVSTDGVISSYSVQNGKQLWSTEVLQYRELSAPAIIGESIAVVDLDGVLHLLSPQTGDVVGRVDTGRAKGLVAPVDLVTGALVQLQNGQLIRLDLGR